jgi:hypothetical protein
MAENQLNGEKRKWRKEISAAKISAANGVMKYRKK